VTPNIDSGTPTLLGGGIFFKEISSLRLSFLIFMSSRARAQREATRFMRRSMIALEESERFPLLTRKDAVVVEV
jgi:hypothetical protein